MLDEVTELAALQPAFRALIRQAFEQRLGPVELEFDFHRGWNGGWRCRATVTSKRPLEFALLQSRDGALLALPVPFPAGWRRRGVADSAGRAWAALDDHVPRLLPAASEAPSTFTQVKHGRPSDC